MSDGQISNIELLAREVTCNGIGLAVAFNEFGFSYEDYQLAVNSYAVGSPVWLAQYDARNDVLMDMPTLSREDYTGLSSGVPSSVLSGLSHDPFMFLPPQ